MTDIDVHHLAAAYALDALDDRERAAFEGHYGACEVCRNDVLELHQTLTHVAESLATAPPAAMKAKVMAEVAATRQLSPSVAPVVVLDQRRRARTLMSLAVAAKLDRGERTDLEAAFVKDLGTEFEQSVPEWIREALDATPDAALPAELQRSLSYVTRISPTFSLRGGTRQIMRGIIARGLGLR